MFGRRKKNDEKIDSILYNLLRGFVLNSESHEYDSGSYLDEKNYPVSEEDKNKFTYETFKENILSLEKIGGISSLKKFLPIGLVNSSDTDDNTENFIKKIVYIIDSMTKNEKNGLERLDLSRKIRIAKGSGTNINEVNKVIKLYENTSNLLNNKSKNQSFFKSVLDKFRM